MPLSPFARLFGIVLAVLSAVALLWPDDKAQFIAAKGLAAAPILIVIFTWSVVRCAAPFDDQAFHRTLPPGDAAAFRRVILSHLLLLAVIALGICGYGLYRSYGWQTISYGVLMLTVPVAILMAAVGITASCGRSRGPWKTYALGGVFASPLLSLALMKWMRDGFAPETGGFWQGDYFVTVPPHLSHYLPGLRTMILTALLLYPLIWWLIAVRRRRKAGLFFAAWTGALLPWLFVHGAFFKTRIFEIENAEPTSAPVAKSSLQFKRKPKPDNIRMLADDVSLVQGMRRDEALPQQQWIPMDDLISVAGLEQGEFFSILSFAIADTNAPDGMHFFGIPIYGVDRSGRDTNHVSGTWAGRSGAGQTVWGEQAVWEHLRSRIPAHETFAPLKGSPEIETRLAVDPNAMIGHYRLPAIANQGSAEIFRKTWMMQIQPRGRWIDGGSFDLSKPVKRRLPEIGVVEVRFRGPFEHHCQIEVTRHRDGLPVSDGPWFGSGEGVESPAFAPHFLLIDESGKHVRATSAADESKRPLLLGYLEEQILRIRVTEEHSAREVEALRRSRLHIFFPSRGDSPRLVELPPP